MWSAHTYWLDLAVFLLLTLVSHLLLGHFEEHKPKWRRVGKVVMGTALLAVALHFFGRQWTWGVLLAVIVVAGVAIHGYWLPKHGVHGWTGEPREKYLDLVGATPANDRTVRRYMEAFAQSDREAVLACLTDDVEWVLPGAFHLRGKQEFAGEIVNAAFEPKPQIEVSRLVAQGDVVVAEGKVRTKKKDGQVLDLVFCDVFELRDAKIGKLTSYLHVLPQ